MTQPALNFSGRDALATRVPAQRHSITSRRAAERLTASGCRGPQMAKLLGAYAEAGVPGLTMSEIEARSGLRPSSICSLRDGAVRHGWVLPLAVTRETAWGSEQSAHRITTVGLEALAQWKGKA